MVTWWGSPRLTFSSAYNKIFCYIDLFFQPHIRVKNELISFSKTVLASPSWHIQQISVLLTSLLKTFSTISSRLSNASYHEGQVLFANSRVNTSEIGLSFSNFGSTELSLYLLPSLDTSVEFFHILFTAPPLATPGSYCSKGAITKLSSINALNIDLKSPLSAYPHLMCFKRSLQELWHGADQPAEYIEKGCPYYEFWCCIIMPQCLTLLGKRKRGQILGQLHKSNLMKRKTKFYTGWLGFLIYLFSLKLHFAAAYGDLW